MIILDVKKVDLDNNRVGYQFFDPESRSSSSVSAMVINMQTMQIEFINGRQDTQTIDKETGEVISPFKLETSPHNSIFYKHHPFIHQFCTSLGVKKDSVYYSRIPTIEFEGAEVTIIEMLNNNKIQFLIDNNDKINIGSQDFHKSFDEDIIMRAILNKSIKELSIREYDDNLYQALKAYRGDLGTLYFVEKFNRKDNSKRCYDVLNGLKAETLRLDIQDLKDKDVVELAQHLPKAHIRCLDLKCSSADKDSDNLSALFQCLENSDIEEIGITLDLSMDNYISLFKQIPNTTVKILRFSSSIFYDDEDGKERSLEALAQLLSVKPLKVSIYDSCYTSKNYLDKIWRQFNKITSDGGVKRIKGEFSDEGFYGIDVGVSFEELEEEEFDLSNHLHEWSQRAKSTSDTEVKNEKLITSVPCMCSITVQSELKHTPIHKVTINISPNDWEDNKEVFEGFSESLREQGFKVELKNMPLKQNMPNKSQKNNSNNNLLTL